MKELKLNQFEELNFDEMQQVSGGCWDWWNNFWSSVRDWLNHYFDVKWKNRYDMYDGLYDTYWN